MFSVGNYYLNKVWQPIIFKNKYLKRKKQKLAKHKINNKIKYRYLNFSVLTKHAKFKSKNLNCNNAYMILTIKKNSVIILFLY